jgi:hypothetical protein
MMSKLLFALMMALCVTGLTGTARVLADEVIDGSAVAVMPEEWPAYLEILRQAGSVDDSAIGYAAVKSETYQAFEMAIAQGSDIRPAIEYLLQAGTPAGRVYAAVLLRRLDAAAGEVAIAQLRTEEVAVMRLSGCDRFTVSMAEAIDDMLRQQGLGS